MTLQRILEALATHDPDGNARQRVVRAAANRELLQCDGAGRCLLAVAWSLPDHPVRVSTKSIYSSDPVVVQKDLHHCEDVIDWFDHLDAARFLSLADANVDPSFEQPVLILNTYQHIQRINAYIEALLTPYLEQTHGNQQDP